MATSPIVVADGGEQLIQSPTRQASILIASEELTIARARYDTGEHVAGPHIHHQHTDAFYVLEGELVFEIGPNAETITLAAGGFLAAPPGLAHALRVAEHRPARWLTIHAPDGGFAAFMRGLRDGHHVEWDIAPTPLTAASPQPAQSSAQAATRQPTSRVPPDRGDAQADDHDGRPLR
jgi:quercetin dioxygenase-like cupin family protein